MFLRNLRLPDGRVLTLTGQVQDGSHAQPSDLRLQDLDAQQRAEWSELAARAGVVLD